MKEFSFISNINNIHPINHT